MFPEKYHAEAFIALHSENGKETPGRIGGRNFDGTHDHGCLQINPKYWYQKGDSPWTDFNSIYNAEYNIKVAYHIFQRSNNTWSPWYGPCTKGKEKLPKDRCGR